MLDDEDPYWSIDMTDCLFCKMVNREIEPDIVYEDADVLAFRDVNPQAPTHVLVIPKAHIATTNDLDADNAGIVGKLYLAAKQIAADEGIAEDGFRLVVNCNRHGCQEVFHLHMHLVGGRQLRGISAL